MDNFTQIDSPSDAWCPNRHVSSVFFTAAMAITTTAAFIGNILVILTVYKTPTLRTSTNCYYVNMAVSDFIASLTTWPLYLTDEIITRRGSLIQGPLPTVGCNVGMYVRAVSFSVSVPSLVLIAIDRLIATEFPFKASLLSRKIRIVLMCATWALAMGYNFPMFYFSEVADFGEETFCVLAWNDKSAVTAFYYVGGFTILLLVPLIAIIVLYSRIIRVLRPKRNPRCDAVGSSNIAEEKRRKQSQNIMRIFKTIVIGYSACIFPFCVYLILKMTFPEIFVKDTCKWILGFSYFLFPSLSTGINPVILFYFSSNFLLALQTLCPCCLESHQLCCHGRDTSVAPEN